MKEKLKRRRKIKDSVREIDETEKKKYLERKRGTRWGERTKKKLEYFNIGNLVILSTEGQDEIRKLKNFS